MWAIVKNIYQQNESGVLLPYRLVEDFYERGLINALGFFVSLKRHRTNGIFYNPSYRKIARLSGYSHSTVRTYLKQLIDIGLIDRRIGKDGKHQLCLRGFKFYRKIWGKELIFIEYGTKKEIHENLKSKIVIRHIKAQEFRIGKKQGRNRKLDKIVESTQNYASLSDRNLARLMRTSIATANRMKSSWVSLGIIALTPMWEVLVRDVSYEEYRRMKSFGGIPVYALYQRNRRRVVIRKADAVSIGEGNDYKYAPYSWVPSCFTNARSEVNTGECINCINNYGDQ